MSSETAISRWLQAEMPRRGYPLGGPRSGGISRLAEDADIPQASMSRLVNGRAEPSVDNLRKLGLALKIPLSDMLVHAGLAKPEEVSTRVIVGPVRANADIPPPTIDIPPEVDLESLPAGEVRTWLNSDWSIEARETAIMVVRLIEGRLKDPESLIALKTLIDDEIERVLRSGQSRDERGKSSPPFAS